MYQRINLLGINADIDVIDLPPTVWSESLNMVAKPGAMSRARGYSEVYPGAPTTVTWMLYTPQLGEPFWIETGFNQMKVIDPTGVHVDIFPADFPPGAGNGAWNGGNLNGIAIVNTIDITPYYWFNGIAGADAVQLPGMRANTNYRIVRTFKYHVIGLGVVDATGDFRDAVHWSDAADPGQVPQTWVPAADNEAGDNILADENGAIIDGMALRDSFFIYKQDSVYEMTYIGGSSVFRFRKVFGTTGLLAQDCIARVKGTHVVLGNGDIYQHDGQNLKSIVDGRVRETFFAIIDPDAYEKSFVIYVEAQEEVWFCVPRVGQTRADIALVWNTTTNEFGYRELPGIDHGASGVISSVAGASDDWDSDANAWDTDTTPWLGSDISATEDAILLLQTGSPDEGQGAIPTKYYQGNVTTQADGATYESTIARMGLDLGDSSREKAIRRIWPRMNAPSGTQFTLQCFNQRDPFSGQELVESQVFEPGTEGIAVNFNARYMGLRITTNDSVDWNIGGFDVEYMPQGFF